MHNADVRRDPEEGFPSDVPSWKDWVEYNDYLEDVEDATDDVVEDMYLAQVARMKGHLQDS